MGLPRRSSHLGCRFIWPNIFIWTVHDVKGMFKMVNMTFRNKKKQSHVIVLPEFVIKLVEITILWIWAKARSWILVKTWFFWRCAFSKLLHGNSSYTFWALKKVFGDILRHCQFSKMDPVKELEPLFCPNVSKKAFCYHFDPLWPILLIFFPTNWHLPQHFW